jgi:hypothetical protein
MTASGSVPGKLPDLHTTAGKIADLERRRFEAVHAGPAAATEVKTKRDTLPHKKHGNIPL